MNKSKLSLINSFTLEEFELSFEKTIIDEASLWCWRDYSFKVIKDCSKNNEYFNSQGINFSNALASLEHNNSQSAVLIDNRYDFYYNDASNSHFMCIAEVVKYFADMKIPVILILMGEPCPWKYSLRKGVNVKKHIYGIINSLYGIDASSLTILEFRDEFGQNILADYPKIAFTYLIYILNSIVCPRWVIGIAWGSLLAHQILKYINHDKKILFKLSRSIEPFSLIEDAYDYTVEPGLSPNDCMNLLIKDGSKIRYPLQINPDIRLNSFLDKRTTSPEISELLGKLPSSAPILISAALGIEDRICPSFISYLKKVSQAGTVIILVGVRNFHSNTLHIIRSIITHDNLVTLPVMPDLRAFFSVFRQLDNPYIFVPPFNTGNGRTILWAALERIPILLLEPNDSQNRIDSASICKSLNHLQTKTLSLLTTRKIIDQSLSNIAQINYNKVSQASRTFPVLFSDSIVF